ncbi:MAG TPA: hypothetical protein VD883_02440, partial [Candidatus Omnitrophota bacterium]|nr:hypothetical protein [Candidatus Omnitrophota bacterium]
DEYVYKVLSEYRDGLLNESPNMEIGYNFRTGVVWEHDQNQDWKLYSKDGFPLYVTRFDAGKEYRYSRVETKTFKDGDDFYILHQEVFSFVNAEGRQITTTETIEEAPRKTLIKDGQIIAVEDKDGVHIDPYGRGLIDKLKIGSFGRMYTYVREQVLDTDLDATRLIGRVDQNGVPMSLNNIEIISEKQPYYSPLTALLRQWPWLLFGGLAAVVLTGVFTGLHRRIAGWFNNRFGKKAEIVPSAARTESAPAAETVPETSQDAPK